MTLLFYSGNLVDTATITPSTVNLNFPVSNIVDPRRTKVFRSTSNTSSLVMDFSETSEIDSVFLVDEPRNGFGISSVNLLLNATSDFTSPAHTEAITLSPTHGVGFKKFIQQDYRFAKLELTSTLGYCELSKIFIGKAIDLGRGPNFNWSYQDKDISTIKENRYGQRFVDVITRQKQFNINMNLLNKDQMDKIFQIYDEKSNTKPFFVSIGCSTMINDINRFAGMVYLNAVPTITNTSFGRYSLSMQLEEAM
jgi:hypothetical protein